ncbi:MAG: glucose-6-phosphate isomerase, partial [Oscillospiraceae bacterium]|nr:glucose-6-phosphate isomerase [Oscillospiraceae bacterium]
MDKVTFDYSKAEPFIKAHEVEYMSRLTKDAKELLLSRTGAG